MNKIALIFIFEFLVCVVFFFFYMGVWTCETYSSISKQYTDTGFIATIHLIVAVIGNVLINEYRK